jgi:hypothetical protein
VWRLLRRACPRERSGSSTRPAPMASAAPTQTACCTRAASASTGGPRRVASVPSTTEASSQASSSARTRAIPARSRTTPRRNALRGRSACPRAEAMGKSAAFRRLCIRERGTQSSSKKCKNGCGSFSDTGGNGAWRGDGAWLVGKRRAPESSVPKSAPGSSGARGRGPDLGRGHGRGHGRGPRSPGPGHHTRIPGSNIPKEGRRPQGPPRRARRSCAASALAACSTPFTQAGHGRAARQGRARPIRRGFRAPSTCASVMKVRRRSGGRRLTSASRVGHTVDIVPASLSGEMAWNDTA